MANTLDTNINVNTNAGAAVNQFKALKNELRGAIGELAGLEEGTAAFNAQAARVGQLRDQIQDLNATVASVSGSPIENLSGSFGLLSGQVSSLDFDGATSSLSNFSSQIKSFSFKDLIAGGKQFITTLGSLGKALLSNPIFLIASVLIAVGVAVYKLKDSVNFLGDAFDFVGDIISGVVLDLKDFLDYIGLTNFAVEDKANRTIESAKAESIAIADRYDREIKVAQAAGKDTKKIEEEKRQAILGTIKAQVDALKKLREINGEYTEDQLKQLKDLTKQFNDIETEKAVNDAKLAEDAKKTYKANNDAKLAANKQLQRQIQDEEINAIVNEEERATAKAALDKSRRDEDINASKASAEVKREALVASELQLQTDMLAINKTANDKRKEQQLAYLKSIEEFNQKSLVKSNELAIKDAEIELSKAKSVEDRFKLREQIIKLNTQKEIIDLVKAGQDEINAQKDLLDKKIINEQEYAERVKKINNDTNIAIASANEASAVAQTENKKKSQEESYAEFQANVGEVQGYVQVTAEAINNVLQIIQEVRNQKRKEELDSITEQSNQELAAIDNQLKNGLISKQQADDLRYKSEVKRINAENKAKEKAFEEDKKMRIAQTVISTITGSLQAFTGAMSLGYPAGPIVGGIMAGIVTAMGAVSVANINKQKFSATALPSAPSGGNIGDGASIDGIQSSSKFKSETIGQAGTSDGGNNEAERKAQRVYVLESDITNTQKKVQTIESQATIG